MHDHDEGLRRDLKTMMRMTERRRMLHWIAGVSLVPLIGCGDEDTMTGGAGTGGSAGNGGVAGTGGSAGTGGTDAGGSAGTGGVAGTGGSAGTGGTTDSGTTMCAKIPEETAGPYPGDGSNGVSALVIAGVVRSDIRSSFGTATGTAEGVPLTVKLTLVAANGSCARLAGRAIYIWHCDRAGNYSMYTIADQNYLRGVQETDSDGTVTFTTIFPACYSGRWPHIHFEIYESLDAATTAGKRLGTSQLALPADICNDVFSTAGYETSVRNLAQISLASDMVFSDGVDSQMATVAGSVAAGFVANLTIAVNA
jgi:protocatechuate 3,4-dioxygenase beta subunit